MGELEISDGEVIQDIQKLEKSFGISMAVRVNNSDNTKSVVIKVGDDDLEIVPYISNNNLYAFLQGITSFPSLLSISPRSFRDVVKFMQSAFKEKGAEHEGFSETTDIVFPDRGDLR